MPLINDSNSTATSTDDAKVTTTSSSASSTTTADTTADSTASIGTASVASVAYYFSKQFQSFQTQTESLTLTGNRALANDVPLWSYVSDAVKSSLRTCASGPNGEFVAWYPDWFGKYDNTPVVEIEDVELIDFKITQSDAEFYSHVYARGVTPSGASVGYLYTQGVVSIESNTVAQASTVSVSGAGGTSSDAYAVSDQVSAILSEMINIPSGEEWKYTPKELYRRYGARKKDETCSTLVESGSDGVTADKNPQYILPFLHALYSFMKHWANQYKCTLTITFMPNIFPGYRVKVKSLGISMYVTDVSHSMSYDGGFTTSVTCAYPSGSLVSGMLKG